MAKTDESFGYSDNHGVLNDQTVGICKTGSCSGIFCKNSIEDRVRSYQKCLREDSEKCKDQSLFRKYDANMVGDSDRGNKSSTNLVELIVSMVNKLPKTIMNVSPEVAKYELENTERVIEMFLDKIQRCKCQRVSQKQVKYYYFFITISRQKYVGNDREIDEHAERCTRNKC